MLSSCYLTFFFLANISFFQGTYDPFFGYRNFTFDPFKGLYIVTLFMIVICSLGNRPQGCKWIYILCIHFFALIMLFMLYLSYFAIYQSICYAQQNNLYLVDIFKISAFRDLLIAVVSTYGLYIFSSILYLEPWHLLTSLIPYLLFLLSFVNVLNVYAFCNLHDISW